MSQETSTALDGEASTALSQETSTALDGEASTALSQETSTALDGEASTGLRWDNGTGFGYWFWMLNGGVLVLELSLAEQAEL